MDGTSVGFIGAGTLGRALAQGMDKHGYRVTAVSSRSGRSAMDLAALVTGCEAFQSPQEVADRCKVVFITCPDAVIYEIASRARWHPEQGVVHCSGVQPLDVLEPAARQGAATGSFHPFQTFACVESPAEAVRPFQGVGVAVEGSGWLARFLDGLASDLGCRSVHISPEDRALYHASAVMSCGYLVALLKGVSDIWEGIGVPREDAMPIIMSLVNSTVENVNKFGMEASVTGPASRGDVDTVRQHLEALESRSTRLAPLYRCLAREGLNMARPNLPPKAVNELEQLLQTR